MTTALDHFFILTDFGAPQASSLLALGLVEGTANTHPGQGTANRRFFFADAMLELLYLRDLAEAMNGPAARLRLGRRFSSDGASPFGIVLREMPGGAGRPFPGWPYRPDYVDPDQPFLIGDNSSLLEEPLCIVLPGNADLNHGQTRSGDPFGRVSELRLSVPVTEASAVLQALARLDRISLILGAPHCIELIFKRGEAGQSADLRPELPLVLRW
jgi:hypothetical protein